ncbi:RNA binding protein Rnp24 [Histoplasma capsulatum H143]|uniref:RNA binding protein Rnp24 n=1 Tax=Ajellomyces capsulatus (strain H143) TaxID=544712 RepID=C6H937_AJECH|nr:RNA binding protein Rnp24 [Histoplasma capsulatum H143]
MSGPKEATPSDSPPTTRKRKLDQVPALEIDLSAPEPPSKKALRKAKKKSAASQISDPSAQTSTINPASKPQATEQAEKPSKRSGYGVWVGNLPFVVKKDDIRAFFTSSGTLKSSDITRIHLPEGPKQNGKAQNKGFAYVDFTSNEAMETAIAMSEQLINGRRALIKNAKSFLRKTRQPGIKTVWKGWTSKDKFEALAIEEVSEGDARSFQKPKAGKRQRPSKKGEPGSGGRYGQDVVHRLRGAIVESQGKKTTFG